MSTDSICWTVCGVHVASSPRSARTTSGREGDYGRVSVPSLAGEGLRDLIVAENAQGVIEIGLAYGGSALAIGEGLVSQGNEGKHDLIIDAHQDQFHDGGWQAVVAAGLAEILLPGVRAISSRIASTRSRGLRR